MDRKRTEISDYGKVGLINHLTDSIQLKNGSSLVGIGDDAAVLAYPEKNILITNKILLEGIHFDLTFVPLMHLGYKSAIVNFSDIYAMNGVPKQIILSIGVSKRFSVEDLEDFYAGVQKACDNYGVDLVGADTSSSLTGLTISLTCIGEVEKEKEVLRNGAKENDILCVTGDLGASYMGLQLLEREKQVFNKKAEPTPDFAGKEYLLQRQLRPEARKDIIELLARENIRPTSMINISDGLSSEILHICKGSNCGCRIYEDKIPIDYQTATMAEEMNMNLSVAALNGGEDYELLFTIPLSMNSQISKLEEVHPIGYICSKDKGIRLISRDQKEFDMIAQGWKSM